MTVSSELQCPVCGYYCLGNGGIGCIDKPSMVANESGTAAAVKYMNQTAIKGGKDFEGAAGRMVDAAKKLTTVRIPTVGEKLVTDEIPQDDLAAHSQVIDNRRPISEYINKTINNPELAKRDLDRFALGEVDPKVIEEHFRRTNKPMMSAVSVLADLDKVVEFPLSKDSAVRKDLDSAASAALAFHNSDPIKQLRFVRSNITEMVHGDDNGDLSYDSRLLSALDNAIETIERLRFLETTDFWVVDSRSNPGVWVVGDLFRNEQYAHLVNQGCPDEHGEYQGPVLNGTVKKIGIRWRYDNEKWDDLLA